MWLLVMMVHSIRMALVWLVARSVLNVMESYRTNALHVLRAIFCKIQLVHYNANKTFIMILLIDFV